MKVKETNIMGGMGLCFIQSYLHMLIQVCGTKYHQGSTPCFTLINPVDQACREKCYTTKYQK
ncbi:hypothetical protein Hanom_Chr14g01324191 [Helianthus anomalus]